MATVLVIGGGGREHALAWKLSQSADVRHVYVSPGNAGTESSPKTSNVALNVKTFEEIQDFCVKESVSLVVVGPEDPLAAGISDYLNSQGVPCFGPSAEAAQIEASKDFAKKFMSRHGIPTARFSSFTDVSEACQHINQADYPALVVKASGLAAGKGVVVAKTQSEACQAVRDMLNNKVFGSAGETVVIEELLTGHEVSCLAFSDGSFISMMPPAQDHKQLSDGDTGPNTGGMGAVCPYPMISDKDLETIRQEVLQRAVDGMKEEGFPFIGVLYAGIMLTSSGPKVLEFNCRFGDPETQSILPLLESDLYEICQACVEGKLSQNLPQFTCDLYTAGVVLVSGGYPGGYKKGLPITGIDGVEKLGPRVHVFHAGTAKQEQGIVTSGGRVLAVVAMNSDLPSACSEAQRWAGFIQFDGAYHRSDIGFRVLDRYHSPTPHLSYKDSGVNIEAGNSLVKAIQPLAKETKRPGCDASLGGFGALFDIKAAGFRDPILVSGTDGVGTKLKIAQAVGDHSTIGQDLVAMCVNDILAHGAEPLFFLDYFATGRLNVCTAEEIVAGIAAGCKQANCALVGGETAEMPGIYRGEDYDLAGFAVGAVERGQILPRVQQMHEGDVLIGLASSGLHSNGFSLVRKVLEKLGLGYDVPSPFSKGKTLGEELLVPTKIYVKELLPLMHQGHVKAFCHITGGGLVENLPRVLPDHLMAKIDAGLWSVPAVFGWLAEKGNITAREMCRTFNCGVGGVLLIDRSQTDGVLQHLMTSGLTASFIGRLHNRQGGEKVVVQNLQQALTNSWKVPRVSQKKKVGVLISGTGTNLQALIDSTTGENNNCSSEIVLVISNKAGVLGLERAQKAGILTKVINHKDFGSRVEFDMEVDRCLRGAGVEFVCLAGFMRILSGEFVKKWRGHMINVHPSLLPSFKGHNAHEQVLAAGVRISGCTVHFVEEEVDAGAIVVQESVPVYPGDTVSSLADRVKRVEHKAFPEALELVASGQASLKDGVLQWGH